MPKTLLSRTTGKVKVDSSQIDQGLINHVVFVLDASSSMAGLEKSVRTLFTQQIADLAEISKNNNQETRVTVYAFSSGQDITCLCYDKDVLRLPAVDQLYRTRGWTALIDATMQAVLDMEQTGTLYGDHSFLMYILTDGEENSSRVFNAQQMAAKFEELDDWTVAALVPNQRGVRYAQKVLGLPPGNIQVWEATERGLLEASEKIKTSTQAYTEMRSKGLKTTHDLFSLTPEGVQNAVQAGALTEIPERHYATVRLKGNLTDKYRIDETVEDKLGFAYGPGKAYYQLTKREEIQYHKDIAIRHKQTLKVYRGPEARKMIGINTGHTVKFNPVDSPDYDVFIQSTSHNRKLLGGTDLLYFHVLR